MKTLSYTALGNTLAKTMEKVCDDHEPIIMRKSEGAVVMLSLEDYESLEETTALRMIILPGFSTCDAESAGLPC